MHRALKRLTWSVLLEPVLDAVEVLSLVPALTAAARRSYQAARALLQLITSTSSD